MTMVTRQTICKDTGLTEAQVDYRIKQLGIIGTKIHEKLYLYDYDVIKQVRDWKGRDDK